jgi:hypothetical protein
VTSRVAFACALLVASLVGACTKASESSDAKRMPKPPPGPSAEATVALKIDVEIDGAPMPSLDAAKLNATAPDFKDDEHRAWRLGTLLGGAASRAGATITVTGSKDVAITMKVPNAEGDPMPVLSLNRRGEAMVGLVPADQPFPAYHGQGGRLSRPGDPLPRIVGVTRIKVESRSAH